VGNTTRVKVVKNKVAPPFKQVEFDIMYGEGISKTGELLDLGVKAGVVENRAPGIPMATNASGRGARMPSSSCAKPPSRRDRGQDPRRRTGWISTWPRAEDGRRCWTPALPGLTAPSRGGPRQGGPFRICTRATLGKRLGQARAHDRYIMRRPPHFREAPEGPPCPALNDIRSTFLDYFAKQRPPVVDSSPLVPRNDPTLMFANSGMVQFKNLFTGVERATTSARPRRRNACARAASTTTWTMSAIPRGTIPSSKCWAISALATTSNPRRSPLPGNC
jgi:hypothetical protein